MTRVLSMVPTTDLPDTTYCFEIDIVWLPYIHICVVRRKENVSQ
jgi:hypothetical protein